MNVGQVLLFGLPVLAYAVIRHWRQREGWGVIGEKLGLARGPLNGYGFAIGLSAVAVVATWLILHVLPASVLHDPRVTNSQASGLQLTATTVAVVALQQMLLVAFWEELFFRGFLGGWLARRLGFQAGNAVQATLFLLPHLLLLLVSPAFWPLLIVQWTMGWINGWLRIRNGSIGPGLLIHTVVNAAAIVLAI